MRTTSASAKAFLPERHSRAFTISHNKLFSSSPQGGGSNGFSVRRFSHVDSGIQHRLGGRGKGFTHW